MPPKPLTHEPKQPQHAKTPYRAVQDSDLKPSALLQDAVRAEFGRRDLLAETDQYLTEFFEEVGTPTEEELTRERAVVARIVHRSRQSIG